NGIQQTEDFNDFKSHQVSTILTPHDTLEWTVNYYFGQEQPDGGLTDGPDGFFRVFDSYATYTPNARLSFGLDLSHTTNEVRQADPALAPRGPGRPPP